MEQFTGNFEEDLDYYTPSYYDDPSAGDSSIEDYVSSVVLFDGGRVLLSRQAMQIYGGVVLISSVIILGLRVLILPHLLATCFASSAFTNVTMLIITVMQIIQSCIHSINGLIFLMARLRIPLFTMYTAPVFCAAWMIQSLYYLVLIPSTVVAPIFSSRGKSTSDHLALLPWFWYTLTFILFILFIVLNVPLFGVSGLYMDVPMWVINGYQVYPLSGFFTTLNHHIDLFVCFVIAVSLGLMVITYPFTGNVQAPGVRVEVFCSSLYFAVTTLVYCLRISFYSDEYVGKSKHLAAIFYIGSILWGAGKPIIYMAVHRRNSNKLVPGII